MLILNPVGEGAGRYYFDGPEVGRWCGAGRHDLSLDGEVTPAALGAVLQGRHPADRSTLFDRRNPHRRAGWDLILTAPKSVSLLAGLAPEQTGALLAAAHRRACADAFVWLEEHACWARRQGALVPTSGLIAARFGHRASSAGDPHLHTHVLVANAVRATDGRWSALDGSALWLNRRAVSAVYHLALRQQLLATGLRFRWTVHPDGSADIADVPRRAIDATSTRRSQIRDRLEGTDDPAPPTRTAAQRLSRSDATPVGPWAQRATSAGFGPDDARRVLDDAGHRARAPRPDHEVRGDGRHLDGTVTEWLAERRSTFGLVDVIQAVSASHAEGATAADTDRWARDFLGASPKAPDGRRTSVLATALDDDLVHQACARAGDLAPVDALPLDALPADTLPVDAAVGRQPPASRDAVRHLTGRGNAVDILAPPSSSPGTGGWRITAEKGGFVAQAETLDQARVIWQRAGHTVAVDTPSVVAGRRWRALAGLDRHLPGASLPTVLIVDRADRRPTGELASILGDAAGNATKVVLVIGGTLPARRSPLSQAVDRLGEQLGRVVPAYRTGPELPSRPVTVGRLLVCPLGHQALGQVVDAWAERRGDSPTSRGDGATAQMVALGPAECDELNRRARAVRRNAGAITGGEVVISGRPFAVGDEVVGIRHGALPAGEGGRVTGIGDAGQMLVQRGADTIHVDAWNGRNLRHAYAVTPGMLRFTEGPLVALGEPADLGRHQRRVVAAGLVAPTGPRLGVEATPAWAPSEELREWAMIDEAIGVRRDCLTRVAQTQPGRRPEGAAEAVKELEPLPDDHPPLLRRPERHRDNHLDLGL